MNFDPYKILVKLSESRDKGTLNRRLHIYRVNFRKETDALFYLDKLERLSRIRR